MCKVNCSANKFVRLAYPPLIWDIQQNGNFREAVLHAQNVRNEKYCRYGVIYQSIRYMYYSSSSIFTSSDWQIYMYGAKGPLPPTLNHPYLVSLKWSTSKKKCTTSSHDTSVSRNYEHSIFPPYCMVFLHENVTFTIAFHNVCINQWSL